MNRPQTGSLSERRTGSLSGRRARPQYQSDHKDALAQDWPHIPIPKDRSLFLQTVKLGEKLSKLLDPSADVTSILKSLIDKDTKTLAVVGRVDGAPIAEADLLIEFSYYGAAGGRWNERAVVDGEAQRIEWGETTGDLFFSETVLIGNVPPNIWRNELGGYPVLKKWLGYRDEGRRGKPLTLGELDFFRSMVHRIAATLTIRLQLDAAYEAATADAWSVDELVPAKEQLLV